MAILYNSFFLTFESFQTFLVFNFFLHRSHVSWAWQGVGDDLEPGSLGVKLEREAEEMMQGVSRRCSQASKTGL